ncbi:MAG TPA: sensor histidine kinase, partial [Accumulibacter sp.]|nr:sensor histidine kinase [Accumulibacter sp.]
MNPLPSIQARLVRALLAWSLVWSLAVALAVWLAVQQQVEDLLDESLQSAAELLKAPLMAEDAALPAESGGTDATGGGELAEDADSGFAWQVVQYAPADAADVLFSSATAPAVAWRLAPTTGFSDGAGWRVFGTRLADDGRFLYVGQTRDER